MNPDPYNAAVRALFKAPVHAGVLNDAACAQVSALGIRLQLQALARSGRIDTMRFQVFACPHVIAAVETLCRGVQGQPIGVLATVPLGEWLTPLAIPVWKTGRILAIEDALQMLHRDLIATNEGSDHGNLTH